MTAGSSRTVQSPMTHGPAQGRRAVRWTRGRKALFGAIGFGSIAIAAAGFTGSYTAVQALAEEKGFGSFAPVFPLAVDLGIAVLLSLDLALTWVDLKWPLLRYIAWLLTAATITFNAASSWPDVLGSAMHATIPLLFIAVIEAMRNAIAKATAMETQQHMDSIRLARWILSPVATFSIWRAMKLWEIRAYSLALEQYQNKMLLRQDLRAKYGRRWRKRASGAEMRPLRQARLGVAVPPPVEAPGQPTYSPVPAVAVEATSPAVTAVETLPPGLAASPDAAAAAAPERTVAAGAARPVPLADAVLPSVETVQSRERGPGAAGSAVQGAADDGPDAEFDAEDDEAAEAEHEEPPVHLGVAPPGETKVQRAERIFLAHQAAGVSLSKPDLARWAGYKQDGSGRTQYNQLEKKHGPIVPREDAGELDLAWRQEPEGEGAALRSLQTAGS